MTRFFPTSKTKRLTLQGLLAVSVVGLGVAAVVTQIDSSNPAEAAQVEAQTRDKGLDLLTYSRVEELRRSAGLENQDLAALGMDTREASAVLGRLVEWSETNEARVAKARRTVNTAKRDQRNQQRLVRIGQASDRQIAESGKMTRAVKEAEQAHGELLKDGAGYALQATPGKRDAWQRAAELKGLGVANELRYVSGMDGKRIASLRSEAKRQKAGLEDVMSYREKQACEKVRKQAESAMAGVLTAELTALPVPEELRGDALPLDGEAFELEEQE